jgi:beta-1,4-mannosyl-glycoprotein beta-1,4-N-acetylglucosaminyltransferase
MIIDSFIFFNELKMLHLRLEELYDNVDFFILVESKKTFSNKDKKLYYLDNKHLFVKYHSKIINIVLDELNGDNEWEREIYQRNAIQIGLDKIKPSDNDILIISDCDEIPNTELLNQIKGTLIDDIYSLLQETYYYDLESKKNYTINASKILSYKILKELGGCHNSRRYETKKSFENAGWHFSYFGGLDNIILKIDSFSHQEFNNQEYTNKETLTYNIINKKDLFLRPDEDITHIPISENDKLPKNYKILL